LFHIAITISAGQILLLNDMYIAYRLLELLSVILVVVYIMSAYDSTTMPKRMGRMSRGLAFGLILIVTANFGWIASTILYRHVEVLNYLPVWFWRGTVVNDGRIESQARVGFSNSGKLSGVFMIKGDQDPTPALSIMSDSSPGYLRARAFDMYRQSQWFEAPHKELLFAEKNTPFGMYFVGGRNLFRLHRAGDTNYEQMTIRHESMIADAVFSPLGTSFIQLPFEYVQRDDNDIVYTQNSRNGLNYRIDYTRSAYRRSPRSSQRRRMLNVPRNIDPRIGRLAGTIFAKCNTTSEKIDAVIRHFRTNYTYLLAMDAPSDRDKLTYFLLEKSTGYCEYFASGAAILLRLVDVPTRYVTGFLVTQKDPSGDLWVARNMDAHAWVEAWDQEQNQWKIVEATVGQDLDLMSEEEQLTSTSGGGNALLSQLLQAMYEYGLFGALSWLFMSSGLRTSITLMAIFTGAILVVILFRRRKMKKSELYAHSVAMKNPILIDLHKMLAGMDRKVKAAGLRRDINETLHVFSQRLRIRDTGDGLWTKISDWYVEYADLRYCRKISSGHLEQLQQHTRSLRDSL
jgi:hypothetical protein